MVKSRPIKKSLAIIPLVICQGPLFHDFNLPTRASFSKCISLDVYKEKNCICFYYFFIIIGKLIWKFVLNLQGKIHLNVNFDRNRSDEFAEKLRVQIFEACDLTMVNSNCDPFVEVCVKFTNGKQETHRTKVKKKTNCPVFDESFVFTVS